MIYILNISNTIQYSLNGYGSQSLQCLCLICNLRQGFWPLCLLVSSSIKCLQSEALLQEVVQLCCRTLVLPQLLDGSLLWPIVEDVTSQLPTPANMPASSSTRDRLLSLWSQNKFSSIDCLRHGIV